MGVLIDNKQNKQKIAKEKIKSKAKAILNALGCPDAELSILILDDLQITELHKAYLHKDGPTNVIAFPMQEGEFSHISPQLLGDVVISVETALREGQEIGIGMEERFTQLLVHGVLHLLGFDHEKTEEEARKMETKSQEILKLIEHG